MKEKIDEQYQRISKYMAMNKLKLNSDKTHLMILRTAEMHKSQGTSGIELDTGAEVIQPSKCEKLLGAHISQDMKWEQHLRTHDKSAFKILTSRINALWKISPLASFKSRKMIADGIFISSLIYVIQLWGGANKSLISSLQILQNKAARAVTKLGWRTPVRTLLQQCGWLSVRQLIVYHNCLFLFKTKSVSKPDYFHAKFSSQADHGLPQPIASRTRLPSTNGIRAGNRIQTDLDKQNFSYMGVQSWNMLPAEIRQERKLMVFKRKLRDWIKMNIAIR